MAIRTLARRPALTLTVVLTLTLSIGATAAMFAVVDAVLLRPLPFPQSEQLVAVFENHMRQRQATGLVAGVRLDEWNRLTRSFDGIAGSYFENLTDTTGELPERVAAMRTSARFFDVLGTRAALGRTFSADEERFGGPRAIVLSDRLWRTRFGADRSVIGRTLTVGDAPCVVIGVMPPSFRYPDAATEAWVPAQLPDRIATDRQARFYTGVGRIKPGIPFAQAQQDLAAAQRHLSAQFPQTDAQTATTMIALQTQLIGDSGAVLWLLFGATIVVLIAACGNIAGLLLADARRRDAEVHVQFAVGAPRSAIVRQRLLEAACLAAAGSAGGLVAGLWGIETIRSYADRLPRVEEVQVDLRVIAFTIALGVLVTLAFALMPALHATRTDRAIRLEGRGIAGGRQLLHRLLVVGQVSLAVVLLVGAGLLVRSQQRLARTSPGYDPASMTAFRMSAAWSERPEAVANRQIRTLERLKQIPGVVDAALTNGLPSGLDSDYPPTAFTIVGRTSEDALLAVIRQVSANYFRSLRIPVQQGETCRDDPRVPLTTTPVLVNQSFAAKYFPGENPIGHHVQMRTPNEIVGIVADAREQSVLKAPQPMIYLCGLAPYYPDPWYVVRSDPAHPVAITAIRQAMREIEPQRAVYNPRSLDDVLREATAQTRLNTLLFAFFAATASLLVAIGLYGLLTQFVSERTREIGVRLALGARPVQVLSQVVGQSAWVTAGGLVVGLGAAAVLARVMTAIVFGISSPDPLTFVAVPVVLALLTLAVTALPARAAAALDPLAALRQD